MKAVSGKEFCKILERNGWTLARINGSHHIYPVHKNDDLKIGLLKKLLKLTNISENEL